MPRMLKALAAFDFASLQDKGVCVHTVQEACRSASPQTIVCFICRMGIGSTEETTSRLTG